MNDASNGGGTPTDSDDALAKGVAVGDEAALRRLYARYAPLVFHLAAQSLDGATAEEIVQDVFFAVWSKADGFDPGRGTLRAWLLQIAHFRILNELRTRSRRPQIDPDQSTELLDALPDRMPGPAEQAWRSFRRESLQKAVERLPAKQRQALSLAFFEELSHDQVARTLKLPLGTVKTRIRSALRALRGRLAPLGVAAGLAALVVTLGLVGLRDRTAARASNSALEFVTASDLTELHIPAAPGVEGPTHGAYRFRPGTPMAVLALHKFPPARRGMIYQGWILTDGVWTSLGVGRPDAQGTAVLTGRGTVFAARPDLIEVTEEPSSGSTAPRGAVVIRWAGP